MKISSQTSSSVIAELVGRIRSVCSPSKIILFGSAARGEAGPDSDLDVLVVVGGDEDKRAITRAIYRRLIGFGASADVIVATQADLDRYGDTYGLVFYPALREGKEIYVA